MLHSVTRAIETEVVDGTPAVRADERRVQHHPRWMNLWVTVKIWLTTLDAGHRVTALDIEFARFLDREYEKAKHAS